MTVRQKTASLNQKLTFLFLLIDLDQLEVSSDENSDSDDDSVDGQEESDSDQSSDEDLVEDEEEDESNHTNDPSPNDVNTENVSTDHVNQVLARMIRRLFGNEALASGSMGKKSFGLPSL